jgi:hypothetical protein
MGLRSVGGVMDLLSSSCGCWTEEDGAPSLGGGGDSNTIDPFTGGPPSVSRAPDLGTRVPVGRPCYPTRILAVKQGPGLGGNAITEKISTRSSSSSSLMFPSPPSPCLGDENLKLLDATG